MTTSGADERLMLRALELAKRGEGRVEPNPMVGCIVARGAEIIGEGWHEAFGGPHAEVNALASLDARGATLYVTLEPCRHTGKTPPCTAAIRAAGIARVVVAARDPFPQVDGGGIAELQAAGIDVQVGVCADQAREVLAPYLKHVTTGKPWVIGKWAMTLDGKIATRTGESQWISSDESRQTVHQLRSRVDGILVGRRTAVADDPRLTARPPGPRTATRIVLGAPLREGRLMQTINEAPLLVVVRNEAEATELAWVADAGGEVLTIEADGNADRFAAVMDALGRRRMTNVLVEGGGGVLGAAWDSGQMDEVHVFVGPKLVGGQPAPSPVGGSGVQKMAEAGLLQQLDVQSLGGDAYLSGRVTR